MTRPLSLLDVVIHRPLRRAWFSTRALAQHSTSVDDLISGLADERGRAIEVLAVPLTGSAPSGIWVPMAHADYLLHPQGSSPTRRSAVLCHEIGHMVLGHSPALHVAFDDEQLSAIAPTLGAGAARRMLWRSSYSSVEEAHAEFIATALTARLDRHQRDAQWSGSSRLSERIR